MVKFTSTREAKQQIYKDRGQLKEFSTNPNMELEGKSVVVLGNSPALNFVDLELLKKVSTIGVNKICKVFAPDMVIFTDPPILESEQEFWQNSFKGSLLTWHNFKKTWVHDAPNARYFNLTPVSQDKHWNWPKKPGDPFIRQGTTTAYAIQLAVLSRVKTLGILGIDFSAPMMQAHKQDTHFYGSGESTRSTGGGGLSKNHLKFYGKVPKWAASYGVDCYNLSPFDNTPINQLKWPKMSLADFTAEFGDNPAKIDSDE